jgi:hypothetical protein
MWKKLHMKDAPAYYGTELITVSKSSEAQAPEVVEAEYRQVVSQCRALRNIKECLSEIFHLCNLLPVPWEPIVELKQIL